MDKKIKNLIFDFGGVLVDLNPDRCIRSFAQLGLNVVPYLNTCLSNGVFQKMELGEISPKDFWEEVRLLFHAPELTDEQLTAAWNAMLVTIPAERLAMLRKLRNRYEHIYLLSNTNVLHWETGKELFKVEGNTVNYYFDRIFLSCDLHLAKPDAAIFERVLAKTEAEPGETLFIDDAEANCEAAEKLGIHTYCPKLPGEWMNLFKD